METVKLMIELPKEIYNLCVDKELLSNDDYKVTIWESIANGTIISECEAEDCISRADARKAIIDHQYSTNFCEEHNIDHSINTGMALIALSNLPPVTPQEPKTGHWITTRTLMHDGEFYCDKCKCDAPNNKKVGRCPNCGAKMESGDKE